MRDFGQQPSLLRRPLRPARRRLSLRRRQTLLVIAGLFFFAVLLFYALSGSAPANPVSPHPSAPAGAEAATVDVLANPGGKRWLTKEADAELFAEATAGHAPGTAWRIPVSKVVVSLAKSGDVALLRPTSLLRHRRVTDGGPGTFRKWDSIYQPSEHYRIPEWSTPADRDVLVHASIFTSLAAFRDHECALTVRNLFDMAVAPHRLYVGISEERKPSDSSCLSHLGVEDLPGAEARRMLYGVDAPASLGVSLRPLTWADVVAPRRPLDVDAAMTGVPSSAEAGTAAPDGVFLHPGHTAERLSCIAGELETARDQLLLAEDDAQRAASGGSVFRRGRGGPQQQPSRALAGCRVTTRVADPQMARGPTFGRYITSLFYFDQDYYMVVDSHTRFSVDWDAKLITRVFQLPTRGVLSYYPNGYREGHDQEEFGKKDFMLMCNAQVLPNGMPKLGARWMPVAPHPILQGFAAAGFMFGDAQYVLDTPFDPFLPYMFDGEEVLFSARMWTSGWDLYGPGQSDVFHHYGRPNTPKYFSIMKRNESTRRQLAEKRTLHLLRRAHPWVEELVRRGYVSVDGKATLKPPPLPPPEAPETRLIVSDAVAAATREINVWQGYYGMGSARTLAEYWQHTRLTDDVVKEKDSEGRWLGGLGLCEAAKNEVGA